MSISLTEVAAKEIQKKIQDAGLEADKVKLRIGVRGGGCSGFSYTLDLDDQDPAEGDEVIESHGVKIVCDMKSMLYLPGTEIDYKDGLMGAGFAIKNPNATSSCGCGSSFSA